MIERRKWNKAKSLIDTQLSECCHAEIVIKDHLLMKMKSACNMRESCQNRVFSLLHIKNENKDIIWGIDEWKEILEFIDT